MKATITAILILFTCLGYSKPIKPPQNAPKQANCRIKKCIRKTKAVENLCRVHQTDENSLKMTENEFNDFDLRTFDKERKN